MANFRTLFKYVDRLLQTTQNCHELARYLPTYPAFNGLGYNAKMTKESSLKLNPRQEIFAQEIASGKTQESAYILAGYSTNGARINSSKLLTNHNISARVKELQNKNAERYEIGVDNILTQLEMAREMAMGMGQSHAAVLAIMAKAKLLGLINNRD